MRVKFRSNTLWFPKNILFFCFDFFIQEVMENFKMVCSIAVAIVAHVVKHHVAHV